MYGFDLYGAVEYAGIPSTGSERVYPFCPQDTPFSPQTGIFASMDSPFTNFRREECE